jgi:hypothetical protein
VLFYANSTLISGQVPVVQGLGDTGVASTVVPRLPAGVYVITAHYSGDPTFGPAVSNSLNLLAEDFTIACSATSVSIVEGGALSVTCNVASLGGLTGPIEVACAEQNPPSVGPISCTFSPNVVEGTGATTLTIVTKGGDAGAGSVAARNTGNGDVGRSRRGPVPWSTAGGGLLLACAGLLLWPLGRRAAWLRPAAGKALALALLLAGMAATGLGCNNTVTATNPTGTPLGLHTLKITAGADVNAVTVTHNAYLTVDVTP